jgi:Na+/H+ antiporter NhaD/arsenite permease-like protein
MTFLVTKYLNVKAIPFILSEIFISNIGGAATLIGDPPNIIIASKADLSFNSFLVHMTPVVLVVLAVIIPFLVFVFRKDLVNQPRDRIEVMGLRAKDFITDFVLLKKSLIVLSIVMVAFVTHTITHIEPSLIAMLGAGVLIFSAKLKVDDYVNDVEWETLIFFAGLFVMVGALVHVGALKIVADSIGNYVGDNAGLAAGILVVLSAVLSGVVDNIPYVASMSPVVMQLNETIPTITNDGLWWALALGADFGGNLTIVGASANVVGIGLAAARGEKISFMYFAKFGFPVTFISIAIALPYVLIRYF